MNKEYLLTLADFLERKGEFSKLKPIPKGKFDLSFWGISLEKVVSFYENDHVLDYLEPPNVKVAAKTVKAVKQLIEDRPRKATGPAYKAKAIRNSDYAELQMKECRTAACAGGWATTIPALNKAGLKLVTYRESWCGGYGGSPSLYFKDKHGNEHLDFQAAQGFFELSYDQSLHLFDGSGYKFKERYDPTAVAKRIRKLVKKG